MRWSSGAYAPHAFRISAGALAHMRRSVPHMLEISDFGRRCDFKSQCNMSFGTIQTHYQHRTTTGCFYRRTFDFLCSGYALELWRICGTAVPHMKPLAKKRYNLADLGDFEGFVDLYPCRSRHYQISSTPVLLSDAV